MIRWDQYFLQGLDRGAALSERAQERQMTVDERAKEREDALSARTQARTDLLAARDQDRTDRLAQIEAEKKRWDAEMALREKQFSLTKERGATEDTRSAGLDTERRYWNSVDRHLKSGVEMSPEDLATEITDLRGRDDRTDDDDARLDALGRAYSIQRSALRNIRGKTTSIDPENPLDRTETPTFQQGVDLPPLGGISVPGVQDAVKAWQDKVKPGASASSPIPGNRTPDTIIPGVDLDGISSRITRRLSDNKAELAEHNRELASGDERYGFLNIWSRRSAAQDLAEKVRRGEQDKAALEELRTNPNHPRAPDVLSRLNREY